MSMPPLVTLALRLAARAGHARGAAATATSCARATGPQDEGERDEAASACSAAASTRCTTPTSRWRATALEQLAARRAALDPGRPALAEGAPPAPTPPTARRWCAWRSPASRASCSTGSSCAGAGPTYTLDTVRELRRRRAGHRVVPDPRPGPVRRACTPGATGASCSAWSRLAIANRPGAALAVNPQIAQGGAPRRCRCR